MNKLPRGKQIAVLAALCEGNSIRSTVRMTGVAKNTVVKLLVAVGEACARYHDEHVRNVTTKRVQVDEIWSFCYAKQKNVPEPMRDQYGYGDVWTWTAIDADSKLIVSYMAGLRDAGYAHEFLTDLRKRLANRVQLTTDGHRPYYVAVPGVFGDDVDYAMLVKIYGPDPGVEKRYSPPVCLGADSKALIGNPDPAHVSTSYVERQNLTMRMSMRRFTRLTNAFSKKIENHEAAIALYFMHYNFCRLHQTLRVTPAMAAGVSDRLWEIADVLDLLDEKDSN
jgi:IS1 family transposase